MRKQPGRRRSRRLLKTARLRQFVPTNVNPFGLFSVHDMMVCQHFIVELPGPTGVPPTNEAAAGPRGSGPTGAASNGHKRSDPAVPEKPVLSGLPLSTRPVSFRKQIGSPSRGSSAPCSVAKASTRRTCACGESSLKRQRSPALRLSVGEGSLTRMRRRLLKTNGSFGRMRSSRKSFVGQRSFSFVQKNFPRS